MLCSKAVKNIYNKVRRNMYANKNTYMLTANTPRNDKVLIPTASALLVR